MTQEIQKHPPEAVHNAAYLDGGYDAAEIPPTQLPSGGRLSARRGPDGRYIADPHWWERVLLAHAVDATTQQGAGAPDPRSELFPLIGSPRTAHQAELIRERAWTAVIRHLAELSAKGTDASRIHSLRATYMAQFNRHPLASWWLSARPDDLDQEDHGWR